MRSGEFQSCPVLGVSLASSGQFPVSSVIRLVEATLASSTLTSYQKAVFAQAGLDNSVRISFCLFSLSPILTSLSPVLGNGVWEMQSQLNPELALGLLSEKHLWKGSVSSAVSSSSRSNFTAFSSAQNMLTLSGQRAVVSRSMVQLLPLFPALTLLLPTHLPTASMA